MYNQSFECKSWFYHDRPQLYDGQELRLERETDNQHDANAVAIYTKNGLKVGYIPAHMSGEISKRIEMHEDFYVFVMNPYDEELETAPWLHIQDREAKIANEEPASMKSNLIVKLGTLGIIAVPVILFLLVGGCVSRVLF